MRLNGPMLYSAFLHVMLIGLALTVVLLARQNTELYEALNPELEQLAAGDRLESLQTQTLDGSSRPLNWASDGSDRLLMVFTTTCGACRENQTAWADLHRRASPYLDVVGISLDEPEATRAYREAMDLPFEVVVAEDRQALTTDNDIPAVPFTIHVDSEGRVIGAWRGVLSDDRLAQIAANIIKG